MIGWEYCYVIKEICNRLSSEIIFKTGDEYQHPHTDDVLPVKHLIGYHIVINGMISIGVFTIQKLYRFNPFNQVIILGVRILT